MKPLWNDVGRLVLKGMQNIQENLDRIEKWSSTLAAQGWSVPTWIDLVQALELVDASSHTELDDVFLDFYSHQENLDTLYQSLLDAAALTSWRILVHECRRAHEQRLFLVMVPSLFCVLEGVLVPEGPRGNVPSAVGAKRDAQADGTFNRIVWQSVKDLVDEMFAFVQFQSPFPPRLNRHWILHGRAEPSWTEVEALKLLQALHSIVS